MIHAIVPVQVAVYVRLPELDICCEHSVLDLDPVQI